MKILCCKGRRRSVAHCNWTRRCVFHTYLQNQTNKGPIAAAPVPPCQSPFGPPPTATQLVLVSWIARKLASLRTLQVPSFPPGVAGISTAGCVNICPWTDDQISSFWLYLRKAAPANIVFSRILPGYACTAHFFVHFKILPTARKFSWDFVLFFTL